LITSRC